MPVPGADGAITEPLDLVRLLIPDRDAQPIFDNDEITGFLLLEGGNVRRAAAQALDALASRLATQSDVTSSAEISTAAKRIDALQTRATSLRAQDDQIDPATGARPAFAVVDFDDTEWV